MSESENGSAAPDPDEFDEFDEFDDQWLETMRLVDQLEEREARDAAEKEERERQRDELREKEKDDYVGNDSSTEYWRPISQLDLTTEEAKRYEAMMDEHTQRIRPDLAGKEYQFQKDVPVAVAMGHDVLTIAATGKGKSLCYERLGAIPESTYIVISPIRGLVAAQARGLQKIGVSAIGLTADNIAEYGPSIWEDISNCKFQYVVASPEILLDKESPFWKQILREKEKHEFCRRLRAVIVDEVHMMWKWGGVLDAQTMASFRKDFENIGHLRLLFPELPYLMMPATVTPVELDFIVEEATKECNPAKIPKTMVYTDERSRVMNVCSYMRNTLVRDMPANRRPTGPECVEFIAPYTGVYDAVSNETRLEQLTDGVKTRVLVATEAAGMGLDIRDVEIVVQYRIGTNTTAADVWQRLGRCARDETIQGLALLVVDDIDRFILDPEYATVNGFDYSTPLTAETISKAGQRLTQVFGG
ncbi:P-loop containing nucleoside triphosphate hydrolase protein [Ascobolus immersus RN42]|uniref:DNA 3'-5' helicase n=1 Tax=Ascobolus immersus RN42 TaxID=1160509 RepID=A0A3N4HLG0_ASCIM|nr:P-loop containing nucleoside triphosphate hydrolase protein [Ascobolus immersus RN42]